jgi:Tol biopolymer transport system component
MTRTRILLATLTTLFATSLLLVASPAGAVVVGVDGRIVFTSDRDGDREIFAMRSDGTGVIQLTTNTSSDYDPAVSGDGQKVAFISDRDGAAELYVMGVDGSNQVRVTTNLATVIESHPSWAPNGSAIAYAGLTGTDSEIYTVKPDGSHVVNLTNNTTTFDDHPSWSPGGIKIAFDSTGRPGSTGTDVFTMVNDGTGLIQLTTDGKSSNPSWFPDNKNLTYETAKDNGVPGPVVFATTGKKPVGLAVTASQVLYMEWNSDKIKQISSNGTTSTFASLPTTGLSIERYVAVSPGVGGFPPGDVFATVGQNIYQVTPDGLTVTLCANIPELSTGETGITFDTVGTFGNKMILTNRIGPVWTIDWNSSTNSCGVAQQIGDFGAQVEGPMVAPLAFVPFGGQLLAGNEFQNAIFAMSSTGTVTQVPDPGAVLNSPEAPILVPPTVCNLSGVTGAYFIAMEDSKQILMFDASNFTGLSGDVLAPSELNPNTQGITAIAKLQSNGTSIDISSFWDRIDLPGIIPDLEGSAFAPCASGAPQVRGPQISGSGPNEIYKINTVTKVQTKLTNNSANDINPAVSPDGLTVVFQSDRDNPGSGLYELYTMGSDGSNQINISNNLTANESSPDWQAVSRVVLVEDFLFDPATAKPVLGGTVLWDFVGAVDHTATDNSGMGLFDSGTKSTGAYYVFRFVGAGSYPVVCTIHPTMLGTVKVPMTAAPKTGNLTTTFTITWAAAVAPTGYNFDVQIQRPGGTFVDWRPNTNVKSSTFVADGGTGVYSFQARMQLGTGAASGYSAPVSITVNP